MFFAVILDFSPFFRPIHVFSASFRSFPAISDYFRGNTRFPPISGLFRPFPGQKGLKKLKTRCHGITRTYNFCHAFRIDNPMKQNKKGRKRRDIGPKMRGFLYRDRHSILCRIYLIFPQIVSKIEGFF